MCGRFSQGEPSHRIADLFGAALDDDLPAPLFNVPPTERVRIVRETDGARRLGAARWGFRPAWVEGTAVDRAPINARVETAPGSSLFGRAFRRGRCVVPADAFYEWDRRAAPRQPYAIGPADGGMLALAGITARDADGVRTLAILTTRPNGLVAPIHDRMPVIVRPALLDAWLDPATELRDLAPLLEPVPETSVRVWPVGLGVNRVGTDGPELLQPIEPAPTLGLA